MSNYRDECFKEHGYSCAACSSALSIEVHHIDGNSSNNDSYNLMPLCSSCHDALHSKLITINPKTREIIANPIGLYETPYKNKINTAVVLQLKKFNQKIKTLEVGEYNNKYILKYDAVDEMWFIECNIKAHYLNDYFYEDATLDPTDPDAEEYKLNREFQLLKPQYRKMQEDAENGRSFCDIVVEFNLDYESDSPLKILGGQHRARAIKESISSDLQFNVYHSLRVYFALTKDQRAQLSLISNTNIAVSKQLIDRMGEHTIGSDSRNWCHNAGLLKNSQDFADRNVGENRFTVQLLRTFIINFYIGKELNEKFDDIYHDSLYIAKTGSFEADCRYLKVIDEYNLWKDKELLTAAIKLNELNQKQFKECKGADGDDLILRRQAFKHKVFTASIVAAWAYVAGLLQSDIVRLNNHYNLSSSYSKKVSVDPLNSKQMSISRHETADDVTYRGLGARQGTKDTSRLADLFLLQSRPDRTGSITKELLANAISNNEIKRLNKENSLINSKAIEVAENLR